jgi:hypothetical protein
MIKKCNSSNEDMLAIGGSMSISSIKMIIKSAPGLDTLKTVIIANQKILDSINQSLQKECKPVNTQVTKLNTTYIDLDFIKEFGNLKLK